jgi:hypothetical protein
MAIEIGDAVMRFISDSTNLDAAFDKVGPNATKAFLPAKGAADGLIASLDGVAPAADVAGTEIEEAVGKRGAGAIREARGEAALLGEAMGVHLPRHVRSFIAELPGVGEALSAAFSATAILFVAQAIIDLTKKATDFVINMFILTDEMKANTAAIVANNVELLKQKANYDAAEEALQSFGKTQEQVAKEKVASLNEMIEKQSATLREAQDNLHGYSHDNLNNFTEKQAEGWKNTIGLAHATIDALTAQRDKAQLDEVVAIGDHQLKVLALRKEGGQARLALEEQVAKESVAGTQDAELKKWAIEQDYSEKRYQLAHNLMTQRRSIEAQLQKPDEVAKLNADLDKLDAEHTQHYEAELEKQKDAFARTMQAIASEIAKRKPEDIEIVTPQAAQHLLEYEDAAKKLGITLKSNLVSALMTAKGAFDALKESGHALPQELKEAQVAIDALQAKVNNFGHTIDTFKPKSHGLWGEFRSDIKAGETAMDSMKQIGVTAFDDLSKNIESSFQSIVLAQGNTVQALEKATAASLAQIASQAAVKALFYTAEGVAAIARYDYGSAGSYFTAAGEMAAVAAVAGIAGHELAGAGGGSSSNNHQQGHDSGSNTTQGNRSGGSVVGVQAFATGGLFTGPTMALIGEAGREAVLPLDDDRAMSAIRDGVGSGGDTHHHWNINGVISSDKLATVVKQISRMVDRGQVQLRASDSLRITKRSA